MSLFYWIHLEKIMNTTEFFLISFYYKQKFQEALHADISLKKNTSVYIYSDR